MVSEIASLRAVLVEQLRDLHSAETLIAKALPKMAKAAASPDLKKAFTHHLAETREHVARIKGICASLQEKPTGKTCQAAVGLVKEGQEAMGEDALPAMKDLILIAAARRVEHYEMAGYTSACELAQALGLDEALKVLTRTLADERAADAKLAKASKPVFTRAFAAEKAARSAPPDDVPVVVRKAVKKIVRTITG